MTITERRVEAACDVVRLRARAERASSDEERRSLTAAADDVERRYRQLRAAESAELHSAARGIGWEPVI
jgi:hypothetical protein